MEQTNYSSAPDRLRGRTPEKAKMQALCSLLNNAKTTLILNVIWDKLGSI